MNSVRHVTGCHVIQETRVSNAFDDVASTIRLMNRARHVMGCHLIQETRVPNVFDDVASTIRLMDSARHVIGGHLIQVTGRLCSPRHRMPSNSINVGLKCV